MRTPAADEGHLTSVILQRHLTSVAPFALRARAQTQFSCTVELIQPLDDYKTEADYERETCDQLVNLCLEDRLDQIRSSSADPPFTAISWDAACDAVFCCKSVTLSVTARPHDWKGATTVAVTEVCKLGQFGVSSDELLLAKKTLLKDMEDDAEQNDTIPSIDWLEDLMDREALKHVFSDKKQDLLLLRSVLPNITLEMVRAHQLVYRGAGGLVRCLSCARRRPACWCGGKLIRRLGVLPCALALRAGRVGACGRRSALVSFEWLDEAVCAIGFAWRCFRQELACWLGASVCACSHRRANASGENE